MSEIITGGMIGLLLGIAIQRCGLCLQEGVRGLMDCTRPGMVRTMLMALGLGALMASGLGWLAVIDVDMLTVLPLNGGTIIGGMIFGAAMAWAGTSPGAALGGIGGGRFGESLCAMLGCLAGGLLLPLAEPLLTPIRQVISGDEWTWFRVTLDKPYLFAGGFLGQACLGLVILAASLCLRVERGAETADAEPPTAAAGAEAAAKPSPAPDDVQDETFVAILPGEEPVVVDTAAPEDDTGRPEHAEEAPAEKEELSTTAETILTDVPTDPAASILPGEEPLLVDTAAGMAGDAAEKSAVEGILAGAEANAAVNDVTDAPVGDVNGPGDAMDTARDEADTAAALDEEHKAVDDTAGENAAVDDMHDVTVPMTCDEDGAGDPSGDETGDMADADALDIDKTTEGADAPDGTNAQTGQEEQHRDGNTQATGDSAGTQSAPSKHKKHPKRKKKS